MAPDSTDPPPIPDPALPHAGPAPDLGGGQIAEGPPRRRVWTPSPRLTGALAAAMLAAGIGIGAAIGPAPESSLAGASRLPLLLGSLLTRAGGTAENAHAGATPSAPAARTTARRHRRKRVVAAAGSAEPAAPAESGAVEPAAEAPVTTTPNTATPKAGSGTKLPAITKVWLVQLDGSSFQAALASPAAAPYIDGQAIPAGSLLAGWSAIQASAFAADVAEIATTEPHFVETILQPPCPEGAAGAACSPETSGALAAADAFLNQTVSTISASAAYRTSGLIVVSFASIASGAASELPAGSTTATLASQPPGGALLISPFVAKGTRPTTTFTAASPARSLEELLHR